MARFPSSSPSWSLPMTEFQVLAIPICFVLGMGIIKILDGAGAAIRRREQAELHWLPFIWAFIILVFQLQFFTILWNLHLDDKTWTWTSYGLILIHPFMYFLATSLLWPSPSDNRTDNLRDDFDKHGRWAWRSSLVLCSWQLFSTSRRMGRRGRRSSTRTYWTSS